ncbi:MAG: PilT/PilU family type 4a pilus ATPase [candidate division Zixibacteria bacterium]|nr:PilT/PilU family type 4a pilus ATPase [candidate division Zixibacteria bacterium]
MVKAFTEITEKRSARRIPTFLIVEYRLIEGNTPVSEYKEAKTRDLSGNGMKITCIDSLTIGTSLQLRLTVPYFQKSLELSGTVVRSFKESGRTHQVGLSFGQMDEFTREEFERQLKLIDLCLLLADMDRREASDLHLTTGRPPAYRIHGELLYTTGHMLSSAEIKAMVYSLMSEAHIKEFEEQKELNYAISLPGLGRRRVNVHIQRGNVEATYRVIEMKVKSIPELGLPMTVGHLARHNDGLIIVAGPTGSGKSTTLAAMIDLINNEYRKVVITLEDPIEFIHQNRKSIVKQREVGSDTLSFNSALRNVVRQDPNVILIGEVRDLDTMRVALTAAETGHLVLTSLHTSDAVQTIARVLGLFPPDQRHVAQLQLSNSLRGVICQHLLRKKDDLGRVVATEILIGTPAVKALIREGRMEQILTHIQAGTKFGMHTMQASLQYLLEKEIIKKEEFENTARYQRSLSFSEA